MQVNMSGNNGEITIGNMRIQIRGSSLFVNGKQWGPLDGTAPVDIAPTDKSLSLNRDGRVVGDIQGNLEVSSTGMFSSLTLVIEGSVGGSVKSGGDVRCSTVGGSVKADRDVCVNTVGGSVKAGRDVRR